MLLLPIIGAAAVVVAPLALALGEQKVIYFPGSESTHILDTSDQAVFSSSTDSLATHDSFAIASKSKHYAAPFLLDSKDDVAIHLAARTLARDIHTITGIEPMLYNDTLPANVSQALIIGSIGSEVIKNVQGGEKYRASIKGKWESYDVRVSKKPLKHLDAGLVVTGSDRVSLPAQQP